MHFPIQNKTGQSRRCFPIGITFQNQTNNSMLGYYRRFRKESLKHNQTKKT